MAPMKPHISIICPVLNENKNIQIFFRTIQKIQGKTEVILVDGGSSDGSQNVQKYLDGKINSHGVLFRAIRQAGTGKANAVATGFDHAKGKYLIIVDADMSIGTSDVTKCISLFRSHGDDIIASGNRLCGLPKPNAFYWLNYIGNYFFRYYYSWILHTTILDISCGTKAMTNNTWHKIRSLRQKYGGLDTWGDIDWLYYGIVVGANPKYAHVQYKKRIYGDSKLKKLSIRFAFALRMFTIGLIIIKRRYL